VGDYRTLKVWRKAHQLTLLVYRLTGRFPNSEQYGLTSQIRRSAASIAANLAEGCGRDTDPELARYARIALGSASELDYHLLLARDLAYLSSDDYGRVAVAVTETRRMLAALIKSMTDD
jgi:four helix bundle protein